MPRRPQTDPSNSKLSELIEIEKVPLKNQVISFLRDPRTRLAAGIVLVAFGVFVALAYVSYFWTGAGDQSILQRGECVAQRGSIQNIMGLPGAKISNWLIDITFGLPSILLILLIILYGLRLMHALQLRFVRLFMIGVVSMCLGAVTLGFAQSMIHMPGIFHWGGRFGDVVAVWLISYLKPIATMMILLVSWALFLLVADRHFIEHIGMLFTKKSSRTDEQPSVSVNITSEGETLQTEVPVEGVTVQLDPLPDASSIESAANDIEIEVNIEPSSDMPIVEDQSDSTIEDNQTVQEDKPLDIEDTNPVEISEDDLEYLLRTLGPYDPKKDLSHFQFPSLQLLKSYDNETAPVVNQEEQQANAHRIVQTLRNYDVEIESIKATVGPTVTLYEVVPKAGVRIAKIQNLENDIMLSLSAVGIRIIAPMPGKGTVGIEVPNEHPQVVSMHSVIASKRFQEEQKMRLPVAIGRTITNEVFCFDLAKTPHLLVAGATGQGKSVGLNAIITSLLYKKHPAELKFVLVDPKMVEFSIYKPLLRHYMAAMPDQEDRDIIITDCQKVINTLNSLVIEMEDRYSLLAEANCRNVEDYNEKFSQRHLNPTKDVENVVTHKMLHHHYMPYLVIIIDEYGDFIMQAGKEVERPIQRLAQKARAVGMHMILATQRPDVKVVTGTIKANIPTRIAFRTQSVVDSRTVLDAKGADQLIGKGDMLYSGGGNLTRIQCAFVDTPEVEDIVEHISNQQHFLQPYQLPEYVPEGQDDAAQPGAVDMRRLDPLFDNVARYVVNKQEGSTSRLQRAFEVGYNRAGKLSDQLEAAGIVGPNKGPKGRDVLIQDMESLERLLEQLHAE